MIIPQDAPKSALNESESTIPDGVPPPAYEPAHSTAKFTLPNIKPTNYISIRRRLGEVKGTFVLDPTLRLPLSMRPKLPFNSKLHLNLSAFMGEANVVVYVVGSDSESLPTSDSKTRMQVSTRMGETTLVLHAPERRAPISVRVSSRLGETILLLPRSFRGPIRLSNKLGEIKLSEALRAATVSFGNRMFVGNSNWTEEEMKQKSWAGDEAFVDSALGSVFVGYSDEQEQA